MVRDGIEVEHSTVIIGVSITDGFQSLFVCHIAVIQDVIFDFRLMEGTGGSCIFLRGTRTKDHHKNDDR